VCGGLQSYVLTATHLLYQQHLLSGPSGQISGWGYILTTGSTLVRTRNGLPSFFDVDEFLVLKKHEHCQRGQDRSPSIGLRLISMANSYAMPSLSPNDLFTMTNM